MYNSVGSVIGGSDNPAGSTDQVSVTNTGSSTYARYVRVVYYSGLSGSDAGKETLKLTF